MRVYKVIEGLKMRSEEFGGVTISSKGLLFLKKREFNLLKKCKFPHKVLIVTPPLKRLIEVGVVKEV
jgi:hypothetical protein